MTVGGLHRQRSMDKLRIRRRAPEDLRDLGTPTRDGSIDRRRGMMRRFLAMMAAAACAPALHRRDTPLARGCLLRLSSACVVCAVDANTTQTTPQHHNAAHDIATTPATLRHQPDDNERGSDR